MIEKEPNHQAGIIALGQPIFRYGVTLAVVVVAAVVRWMLDPALGDHLPYPTFFLAVIFAAWIGGLRPALFATGSGFLIAWYVFIPPHFSFAGATGPQFLGLGMFLMVSFAIAAFGEGMRVGEQKFEELSRQTVDPFRPSSISSEAILLKHNLRDVAVIGFGLIVSVLVLGALLGYRSARKLDGDRRMVARTHEIIETLGGLLSTLKDAETGQRGYLLTADKRYLEPYDQALLQVQIELTKFKELVSDNLDQQAGLETLEKKILSRLDELKQTVDLMKKNDRPGTLKIVHENTGKSLMDSVRDDISARQEVEQELLKKWADESESSFNSTILFILLPAMIGVALIGVVIYLSYQNLSKRQQAALILAEQKERLRTTLASIGDAVISTDRDGKVTYLNSVAESLTGWTNRMAMGVPLTEVFHIVNESTRMPTENPALRALKEGVIVGLANHTVLIAKDGTERPIDDSASPIRCDAGEIVGCVLVFRDISERKVTEDLLRTTEEQFRRSIARSPIPIIIQSQDGKTLQVSDGWTRHSGYTIDDIPTIADWTRQAYGEQHASVKQFIDGLFDLTDTDHTGEYQIRAKDGSLRTWDFYTTPLGIVGSGGQRLLLSTAIDITERKQAERQLRESEERSAFVRRSSGVGFWYCDLPFDVLQWDDLVKAHFHLPPDAVVTIQTFYDCIHPDDRDATRKAIERSIADRTSYDVDYRTVNPDTGGMTWVRAIGRTFYAIDGTPTRFDGVTLDVSDRKRAEERQTFLIRLTDTLRPLSSSADVQAEASRVLGERLGANRVAYFEVRGDEYVVERDYIDAVPSMVGRYPLASFGPEQLAVLHTGGTASETDVGALATRSRNEKDVFAALQIRSYVVVPLIKDGAFVAGLAVHADHLQAWTPTEISMIEDTAERTWEAVERLRAEAALRASEERRRMALDGAELGTWHMDPLTRMTQTDSRFQEILGTTKEAMDYLELFAVIHPDDRPAVEAAVSSATQPHNPTPYAIEYRIVRLDGSVRWVFAKGRITLASGRTASFDGTIADITARKQLEDERERLVGQLREQDERKDEFLATLAHELRNPLAPIRNGLQVMKLANGNTQAVEQSRVMMERQLEQMVRLVDDLMDVSRISRGKLELKMERVQLAAVISSAAETSRPLIDQMGHDLTVVMPKHPIVIDADFIRLAQVFLNLLNNAAKYSDPGARILLVGERQGSDVVVSVRDTGIGIAADQLPRIFEMFSQVDRSLEKSQGGLGIGLTLVRRLVEMHGGSVEARSEGLGKGSEFVVRLPIVVEASVPIGTASEEKQSAPKSSLRILIVDDNCDSADSLSMMLKIMGNETRTANDGEEAVAVAKEFKPAVILLDIGLPKLNGYEACRRIREQPDGDKIVIIAQTGWGQEEDRLRTHEAGFDHHLVKPVDPIALMKMLSGLSEAANG